MRIGEILVNKKIITKDQLQKALKVSPLYKKKIGQILCELGFIDESQLNEYLTLQLRNYGIKTDKKGIDSIFYSSWKYELIEATSEHMVIAGSSIKDHIIQAIENEFCKKVIVLYKKTNLFAKNKSALTMSRKLTSSEKLTNSSDPYIDLLSYIFRVAINKRASDLHFEPFKTEYLIKARSHGDLITLKSINVHHGQQFSVRLKELINMDISMVDEPQDSQAEFDLFNISVRASSIPVTYGEKIVLRIAYTEDIPSLEKLGLAADQFNVLSRSIKHPNGIILISGPTGSGKTTTLYSLLARIDKNIKNIVTLENPVEKYLPGINQINVESALEFNKFQKALMRQDPDVIFLGEIRDKETAEISVKLSASGHLVLSTIHANDSLAVLKRLSSFGVDSLMIRENLRLSVAQRLAKILCQCSLPYSNNDAKDIFGSGNYRIANINGCSKCNFGIKGRKPVLEYIEGHEITQHELCSAKVNLDTMFISLAKNGVIDVSTIL